jgi:hypothetical protein
MGDRSSDPCVAARHVIGRLLDLSQVSWRAYVAHLADMRRGSVAGSQFGKSSCPDPRSAWGTGRRGSPCPRGACPVPLDPCLLSLWRRQQCGDVLGGPSHLLTRIELHDPGR